MSNPFENSTILVIDIDDEILDIISYSFARQNFRVITVHTAEEGLKLLITEHIDLVIAEKTLPDITGESFTRNARKFVNIPIIIISSHNNESEKVRCLDAGADDYIVKPFGIRELAARTRALLRRKSGEYISDANIFRAGMLIVDEDGHKASYNGRELILTPREFELLAAFVKDSNQVLSREYLLETAWGWDYVVETKTVDTHVKRLRDKLHEIGADPKIIETVRGYGYRLVDESKDD